MRSFRQCVASVIEALRGSVARVPPGKMEIRVSAKLGVAAAFDLPDSVIEKVTCCFKSLFLLISN